MLRSLAVVLLLSWVAPAPRAHADDASTALARSLFRDGLSYVDHGEWQQAADRFERALDLRWSAPVAYNLAVVWIELGRLFDAADLLHRVVREGDLTGSARAAAEQKLAQVEARLGHLTVDVVGASEGTTVELDGKPLPREAWGVSIPADPGPHRLVALRGGQAVGEAHVRLDEGGAERVRLSAIPSPEEAARAAAHDSAQQRKVRQKRLLVASGVIAAITTFTTMVLTAVILSKQ